MDLLIQNLCFSQDVAWFN